MNYSEVEIQGETPKQHLFFNQEHSIPQEFSKPSTYSDGLALQALSKLEPSEKLELIENLRLHMRFEFYQEMKAQYNADIHAFKESLKQEQINKIREGFQVDFQKIIKEQSE